MSKQRRSIAVGDLVHIDERWSADYMRLYPRNYWWYVETTYPLTKRSIVCVLQPGGVPVRRAHLRRPRMKKVEREALLATLQRKAAVDFFADIPVTKEGERSGVDLSLRPSEAGTGGEAGPIPINELASPFSPEEQGLADAINPGGPQWPQEP